MKRMRIFLLLLCCTIVSVFYIGCNHYIAQSCKKGEDCQSHQRCVTQTCITPQKEGNHLPQARITGQKRAPKGSRIQLSGKASSDVDGDALTFVWTFLQKPSNSRAKLFTRESEVEWTLDVPGSYRIQLTVVDALGSKDSTHLDVHTNQAPQVEIGLKQLSTIHQKTLFDASRSRDQDGDPLSFSWKLNRYPTGSKSQFKDSSKSKLEFTPDQIGSYLIQLDVSDGFESVRKHILLEVIQADEVRTTLSHCTPSKGQLNTIIPIRLHGSHFIQGSQVFLDEQHVRNVQYHSSSVLLAQLDLNNVPIGAHSLRVQHPKSGKTESILFQVTPPVAPRCIRITPDTGMRGSTVHIKLQGQHFTPSAQIIFNQEVVPTRFIDETQLEATLKLALLLEAKTYKIQIKQGKEQSNSLPFRVTDTPSLQARILSHMLTPTGAFTNKQYMYLDLTTKGMDEVLQVFINEKEYMAPFNFQKRAMGLGRLRLVNFSTHGYPEGTVRIYIVHKKQGKTQKSEVYTRLQLISSHTPKLLKLWFYDGKPHSIGTTQTRYTYLYLKGQNISPSARVFINNTMYTGKVEVTSSNSLRLPDFNTGLYKEGQHSIYIQQERGGKKYNSGTLPLEIRDRYTPYITTFEPSSFHKQFFTNRVYTHLKIKGLNFHSGIHVFLNGALLSSSKVHRENSTTLYLYNFDTRNMQVGQHTFVLQNTIHQQKYKSTLHKLNLLNGKQPSISSIRSSTTIYIGDKAQLTIHGLNLFPTTQIYINGILHTGRFTTEKSNRSSFIQLEWDTKGLQEGRHKVTLRNTVDGLQYNSKPQYIRISSRTAPVIKNVYPSICYTLHAPVRIKVQGSGFNTFSKVYLDNTPFPTTYNSRRGELEFTILSSTPTGRFKLTIHNRDGQQSAPFQYFEIIPKLRPSLLSVHPSQFHASLSNPANKKKVLSFQGQGVHKNASILINGVVQGRIDTVHTSSILGQVPLAALSKAGEVKLKLRNPNGDESNSLSIPILGSSKPSILQVSPHIASTSNGMIRIQANGRDFEEQSTLWVNGKAYPTQFSRARSAQQTLFVDTLTALIPFTSQQSRYSVQVHTNNGSQSTPFHIVSQHHPLQLHSIQPSLTYIDPHRTYTLLFQGKGFSAQSTVYFNGQALPTQFIQTTQLKVTWKPKRIQHGKYHTWHVQTGKTSSNSFNRMLQTRIYVQSIQPVFFRVGQTYPKARLFTTGALERYTIQLLGSSCPIKQRSIECPITVAQTEKVGVHIGKVLDPQGKTVSTFGIQVLP